MKRKNQPSFYPKPSDISKKWWVVDAKNKVLGRLATEVAVLLTGKHKASYTPGVDMGDFVVVINAEQIAVTGKKEANKKYYRHSGYPGGLKTEAYADVKRRFPERIIERAVKGMLPKTRIKFLNQLKVYAGNEHPHDAQQPEPVSV